MEIRANGKLFDYDIASLKVTPPIFGCTDPSATNYDPSATVDDGSCTYPPPPPSVISAGVIDMPYEVIGEYDYVGGSPEKWVGRYDGLAEVYFDDVKGYWVMEWFGGGVLKNIIDPDNTRPPMFNWVDDGGSIGSNLFFAVVAGDDDPTDPLWSGRWGSTGVTVSGADQQNGVYTFYDNAGDNWRNGAPIYSNGSHFLHAWTDFSTIFDWLIDPAIDGVNPLYYCSDDPYFSEQKFDTSLGGIWYIAFGLTPPSSVLIG